MAIEKQKSPWSGALITICEKCGKSLDGLKLKEDGNGSENLKKHLKSRFKEVGQGKRIRVVTTSCLDVCIKNTVAVAYNPAPESSHSQKVFTVHPEEDRETLFSMLLKEAQPLKDE